MVTRGHRALRPSRRADQQRRRALVRTAGSTTSRPRSGNGRSGSTSSARSTASAPRSASCVRSGRARSCSPRRCAGLTAWSHAAPYCATKAAVIQLAKVAAVEYARDGIRVNCVCPGTFRSAIHDELPAEALDAIAEPPSARSRVGRRPGRRVLLSRERRLALDHRVGDRRRRRLLGSVMESPRPAAVMPRMKISANGFATSRAESGPPGFSHR